MLRIEPDYIDALPLIAQGYRCEGRFAQAISYWEKFNAQEPMNLYGILALFELYDLKGQDTKVGHYFSRIADLGGEQP